VNPAVYTLQVLSVSDIGYSRRMVRSGSALLRETSAVLGAAAADSALLDLGKPIHGSRNDFVVGGRGSGPRAITQNI